MGDWTRAGIRFVLALGIVAWGSVLVEDLLAPEPAEAVSAVSAADEEPLLPTVTPTLPTNGSVPPPETHAARVSLAR